MTELLIRGPLRRGRVPGGRLFFGLGHHPLLGLVVAVVGLLAIAYWLYRQT